MSKNTRIALFITTIIILIILWFYYHPITMLGEKATIIFSSLIMLSFTTFFIEHYFAKPTDTLAAALSVLLLLAPTRPLLVDTGIWYYILFMYNSALVLLSLVALVYLDKNKSPGAKENQISKTIYNYLKVIGNGRTIWFFVFIVTTLFYVDSQSGLFLTLLIYSALILVIDPSKSLQFISLKIKPPKNAIGEIFGVQADSIYLARMFPDAPRVKRSDVVGFSAKTIDHSSWKTGIILDVYQLNQETWLRILTSDQFSELKQKTEALDNFDAAIVYLLKPNGDIEFIHRLVGVICEGSNIQKIRFDYSFQVPIEEGELVEVSSNGSNVLYQVVEGITGIERLESKDKAGTVVGEAVQLGIWNMDIRGFDMYGWVPIMNSPVLKAKEIEPPTPAPGEYKVGTIPGTDFPIFIDLVSAVTHHLAILGVTGSGKSVFARNLLRQIANEGMKIICVDFTGEYKHKLSDLIAGTLIDDATSSKMFGAIDAIGSELDKFANKRDKEEIEKNTKILEEGFKDAIIKFIQDDGQKAVVFELPDVSNSTGILEYTKWFFKSLFQLAREGATAENRICIVLEEAHTIIPEWNFLGVEDKRSNSVVNSISQIALQGRKYGVGFMVIAQRTANVSKTVLTQCNSVVAFQQYDKTSAEFLANYMGADFVASLTRLKNRYAIAAGKAFGGGPPVIFQVPEISEPTTTEPAS